MRSHKEVTHRDEIHGDVAYDPLAVALLDTAALQRLGRVYQLGYSHLVYRGGTHTRLSHCMGAYATADRLVTALARNYEGERSRPPGAIEPSDFLPTPPSQAAGRAGQPTLDLGLEPTIGCGQELADRWAVLRHLVRWAALLHDIGHVPLGHTLEDEFEGIYERHDSFSSPRLHHLWISDASGGVPEVAAVLRRKDLYPDAFERVGIVDGKYVWGAVLLICTWKEEVANGRRTTFEEILETANQRARSPARQTIERLQEEMGRLSGSLFHPYMADIVANTISADYLDYLQRDPHNLGLDVLKDDRVVSRFYVGHDHRRQARMALSLVDGRGKPKLDTCTGVVELVRQRYRFAEIVYYHKAKVSASAMLAKVFHLVGVPPDLPEPRDAVDAGEIDGRVNELLSASPSRRRSSVACLRRSAFPESLLDPDVGDETLNLLMRMNAWHKLENALAKKDQHGARDALHGIALLDAIARRELYKVAFSMNAETYPALSGKRQSPENERERSLREVIDGLRNDAQRRAELESQMIEAAGWHANSLLLYVPPRFSQAKGIETGALTDHTVVTLGDHPAVQDQVRDLSRHYAALWRLMVLVHPKRSDDAIGLSHAVDAFLHGLFPRVDPEEHTVAGALKECCWFRYLPRSERPSAKRYAALLDRVAWGEIDWAPLQAFEKMLDGGTTDEERALGAALYWRIAPEGDQHAAKTRLADRFSTPGSLQGQVASKRKALLASASRDGAKDVDAERRVTIQALDEIAKELGQ